MILAFLLVILVALLLLCLRFYFGKLEPFPLTPGPWFIQYSEDYAREFNIPMEHIYGKITSAIIEGANGYIWATSTPSWDREWFEKRGFDFPRRWVPFEALRDHQGPSGSPLRLDV